MLRRKIDDAKDKGRAIPYDSSVKMLSALSNITQTIIQGSGYFSEVIDKNKELFKALDIPLPETEMDVVYEEDELADLEDGFY